MSAGEIFSSSSGSAAMKKWYTKRPGTVSGSTRRTVLGCLPGTCLEMYGSMTALIGAITTSCAALTRTPTMMAAAINGPSGLDLPQSR